MADEHHRWLDRETAERLLRGEPLDALDDDLRDRATPLADALGALSVPPAPPTDDELPGEAAALAAFRKTRADLADADCPFGATRPSASDAGLVRIGFGRSPRRGAHHGSRRGRPVRLGLAAALAVVMVGGIAAAAGTGVLPTPFDEVTPAATAPVQPPSGITDPSPSPTPSARDGKDIPRSTGPGGAPPGRSAAPPSGSAPATADGAAWKQAAKACRDLAKGKPLNDERRRALESVAGGSSRVVDFCRGMLPEGNNGNGKSKGKDKDKGDGDAQGDASADGGGTPTAGKTDKATPSRPTKGGEDDGDEQPGRGHGKDRGQGKGKGKGPGKGMGHGKDDAGRGHGHGHGDETTSPR
ncbi:hypothetical protein AB0D49_03400 [Streptomyces sp. NPDC048290]|uniref:hypothetical protein n=1 Tax=Streptomyces sp. NPDC048290 TaxID=3155811 RepID=UPI003420B99E